jgi:hypothetical protein
MPTTHLERAAVTAPQLQCECANTSADGERFVRGLIVGFLLSATFFWAPVVWVVTR